MKIVVLDGYTLNPGDLSWDEIGKLGELTVYDRTAPNEIVERTRKADIILTNKAPVSAITLEKLPDLKFITVMATGYDIVDIAAAGRRVGELAHAFGMEVMAFDPQSQESPGTGPEQREYPRCSSGCGFH
jgi:lactate dehydrogenase-like 2-hydroxyacid dehydrogenase